MVILKWYLTCHFFWILASYLLQSVGPQCKELFSHSAYTGLQIAFQIPGSGGGVHFFKRRDGYLSGRCRTLNGITPTVIDNEFKTILLIAKRDFFG
jgi:hypothetical protein